MTDKELQMAYLRGVITGMAKALDLPCPDLVYPFDNSEQLQELKKELRQGPKVASTEPAKQIATQLTQPEKYDTKVPRELTEEQKAVRALLEDAVSRHINRADLTRENTETRILERPCSVCFRWLDIDLFGKKSGSPDGLNYKCKECAAKQSAYYYRLDHPNAVPVLKNGRAPSRKTVKTFVCTRCHIVKPYQAFLPDPVTKQRSGLCNECERARDNMALQVTMNGNATL